MNSTSDNSTKLGRSRFEPKRLFTVLLLVSSALVLLAFCNSGKTSNEHVRIIFDTDMGNDVDDALALGVIHALQSRAECELLAVTVTKDEISAAPFIDAVNTFYGRPDIPIGVVHDGPTPGASRFTSLADNRDHGSLRYPHDLRSGADAPEASKLLRRILTDQPDGSVTIVQVGFSTNLARLLETGPDEVSPLTGHELVEKKVRQLTVMAGAFAPVQGSNRYLEYNVRHDVGAAKKIAAEWPTPIIYSGFEIGLAIPYPANSIQQDFAYVAHHPLAEAYHLYDPPPHERPTWDLTSVLYAVRPDRAYFDLSEPGQVLVQDDGFTRFEARADGRHRYLIVDPDQVIRVREALVHLVSQPPRP